MKKCGKCQFISAIKFHREIYTLLRLNFIVIYQVMINNDHNPLRKIKLNRKLYLRMKNTYKM